MKKMFVVIVFMVLMFLCSTVEAFDGRPPHEIPCQLPADKEILFKQTMRGVWDATTNIRKQVKEVEGELKDALSAPKFNEALFLEKARRLQELHKMAGEAMDKAVAKLATQLTAEERKILAELISRKPGPPSPPPGRSPGPPPPGR